MIPRKLAKSLKKWAMQYPVVTVTGPRQSGKTTICRAVFPDKPYVSLEDLDIRAMAKNDPRGFLTGYPMGAILDEIQTVPTLVSYIQTDVDAHDQSGRWILTGSRQFEMMSSVSQSLAGRTAVAKLFPFSFSERFGEKISGDLDEILYTGFYPRVHDKKLDPTEAMSFYVSTYLEKDVRQVLAVTDLSRFEVFLKLCAGRVGQLLNMQSLGNDCGVTHNTIKSWLSVLEASGVILLLRPWHANIGKRLVKSPKLYFMDSGLACYLLGIRESGQLRQHPLRGGLFETLIVSEAFKQRFHAGLDADLNFYRDSHGLEVDLLRSQSGASACWEIKSAMTISADFFNSLKKVGSLFAPPVRAAVIYGGEDGFVQDGVNILSWRSCATEFLGR